MATEVGTIDRVTYYAETMLRTWNFYGLLIEVHHYSQGMGDLVTVTDLGRVKNNDETVDKVREIVERKRALIRTLRDVLAPTSSSSPIGDVSP